MLISKYHNVPIHLKSSASSSSNTLIDDKFALLGSLRQLLRTTPEETTLIIEDCHKKEFIDQWYMVSSANVNRVTGGLLASKYQGNLYKGFTFHLSYLHHSIMYNISRTSE
jgi:hypothetical protein